MAAATFDTVASRVKGGNGSVQDFLFESQENYRNQGPLIPYNDVQAIATTGLDDVGDVTRLTIRLPAGTYIHDWRGNPSDYDTAGSPLHVYDIVAVRDDGTVVLTLVSGSTKGQTGTGTDRIQDSAAHRFIGECYIAMKTTTAAGTPAAGTYKIGALFSIGTLKPTKIGTFLLEGEV